MGDTIFAAVFPATYQERSGKDEEEGDGFRNGVKVSQTGGSDISTLGEHEVFLGDTDLFKELEHLLMLRLGLRRLLPTYHIIVHEEVFFLLCVFLFGESILFFFSFGNLPSLFVGVGAGAQFFCRPRV